VLEQLLNYRQARKTTPKVASLVRVVAVQLKARVETIRELEADTSSRSLSVALHLQHPEEVLQTLKDKVLRTDK